MRSSKYPIKPDKTTVKAKIKVTFEKSGNSIIKSMEVIMSPNTILIPPDSATVGRLLLCISIPTQFLFDNILINLGIIRYVEINPIAEVIIKNRTSIKFQLIAVNSIVFHTLLLKNKDK